MALLPLTVTYDGGKTEDVDAGQRDAAQFELQPFGCSALTAFNDKPVTYLRFCAWSALKRKDALPKPRMTFDAWSDTVDSVEFRSDESETDPTQQGQ